MSKIQIAIDGKVYNSIKEAAREFNLESRIVAERLRGGWSPEEAVELVYRSSAHSNMPKEITISGIAYKSVSEAARTFGINYHTFIHRLKHLHWTPEQAAGIEPVPNHTSQIRKPAEDGLLKLEEETGLRTCRKCTKGLAITSFRFNSGSLGGRKRTCKTCERATYDKSKYGSSTARTKLLATQNSRCICGSNKRLNLDHDHTTGEIRGLLCTRCNTVLGFCEDNPETLHKLIQYLEDPPAKHVL